MTVSPLMVWCDSRTDAVRLASDIRRMGGVVYLSISNVDALIEELTTKRKLGHLEGE